MRDPLRIAFVGAGMVSDLHHRALPHVPELSLAGVFDVDRERRGTRAAEWGVMPYDSLGALLADDAVDAVHVLTSEAAHVPVARAALEAGKHVLVEKPVSADPAEARELIALADQRGLVAMPAHNYAHVPEFTRMTRLARSGQLGRVRSVHVVYAIAHPEEIARQHTGVLGAIMVHHSYLAIALLGVPDRVHAGVSAPGWKEHDGEDQAWMTWDYDDGAVAHLSASFAVSDDSADPWTFVVKALGTDGSAAMSFRSSYVRRPLGTLTFGIPVYEESYEHELRAFAAAIRDGAAPVSTMEDAARCSEIIEGAYTAAASGRPWVRPQG
jgi:predicted dehydrogenase